MNTNDWLAKLPSPLASANPDGPRQWYRIQPAAQAAETGKSADEVDVYVYGVIGGWWSGVDAATFVRELRDIDAKQINVHINSVGGSVYDGNAIFQALRNHKARIVTYVDALAASAASVVAMAGDHRVVAPYAELMVHKAWGLCIGNDDDMEKTRDDLARISRTLAKVYTNRSTSDATVDDWLEVMRAETWYDADEAVDAGLMHEVQEDAEKTTPDNGDDDAAAMNRYVLEFFGLADRVARQAMTKTKSASDDTTWTTPPVASSEMSTTAPTVEKADPEPPAAEPDQPTEPKEDPVSDLTELRSRLGLADDADETAIVAALDALKAKAEEPHEPTPDPEQEKAIKAQAEENTALRKEVDLLNSRMEAVTNELSAAKAEKAAATKKAVLDEAEKQGKFRPADRAQWETDYDEAPQAVTRMLARIAPGTAVPVTPHGEATDPDTSDSDADWDREFARIFPPEAASASKEN
ncbi:head maturation protease, ClpP-related [Plantactinospora sp. WMMB782]|uniref:head maturation protease, ClpP-related n=1 Tax=Plantactinospora sp. WMMB782 TaxID=3404121 RepID=UPI003B928757